MSIFFTDTGSFFNLQVSKKLSILGSGSELFTVTGSSGDRVDVFDLTAGSNIFQITSASIDVFRVNQNKEVHISGSLIVTGSITADAIIANLNVSDSAASNNISNLVFSNANGVSFGLDGSTLTGNFNNGVVLSYYNPKDAYLQDIGSWGSNSLFMQPFQAADIQFDRVAIPIFFSKETNTNSNMSFTFSMWWGLYSRNVSTLSLMTAYTTMSSMQSVYSSSNTSLYSGIRLMTLGLTNTISEGRYYVAMLSNITTAGTGTISNLVQSQLNSSFYGLFGQAANQSIQYTAGQGIYSATTNNLPSSIAISQLYAAATGTAAANSTNTLVGRQPVFYLVSNTY